MQSGTIEQDGLLTISHSISSSVERNLTMFDISCKPVSRKLKGDLSVFMPKSNRLKLSYC